MELGLTCANPYLSHMSCTSSEGMILKRQLLTSTFLSLAPLHVPSSAHYILFQRAYLWTLWTDNLDYTNKSILIVQDRLNMSSIEPSIYPGIEVSPTFPCVHSRRCRNEEDLDDPCGCSRR